MARRSPLAVVSAAQLAVGLAGMLVAVRRRRHYEFLVLRGKAEHVRRDSVLLGTALSAPVVLLAAQAVAIRTGGATLLRLIGATYVVGYLGERLVRARLTPSGFDPVETPVAVAGIALAAAMTRVSAGGPAPPAPGSSTPHPPG
jgi:hypothetical protein